MISVKLETREKRGTYRSDHDLNSHTRRHASISYTRTVNLNTQELCCGNLPGETHRVSCTQDSMSKTKARRADRHRQTSPPLLRRPPTHAAGATALADITTRKNLPEMQAAPAKKSSHGS